MQHTNTGVDTMVDVRIVLQGAYGNGNSGDDAILLSVQAQLSEVIDGASFSVISLAPDLTRKLLGSSAEVCLAPWRSCRGLLRNIVLMHKGDLYVFGGGGLLSEQRQAIMIGLALRLMLAKLFRVKAMIYGVGVNPIVSARAKALARSVVALADRVTVRDEYSHSCLRQAGVAPERVLMTADPAITLGPGSPEQAQRILRSEGIPMDARPLLGLCLAHALGQDDMHILAAALESLMAAGTYVLLLPFERYSDLPVSRDLCGMLTAHGMIDCLSGEYNPKELKSVLAQLDLLVSMRLHPLIFALDEGIPMLALSFVPKTAALMQCINQSAQVLYMGYMAESGNKPALSVDNLLRRVEFALSNRDKIRLELLAKRAEQRSRAETNAQIAASLLR